MTPSETLALAQQLLDRPDSKTAGLWPRAAAFLARQALEQSLAEYWTRKGLSLCQSPVRIQLICLRSLVEARLAGHVAHTWAALSRACHQHPYELAPAATELAGWIQTTRMLSELES